MLVSPIVTDSDHKELRFDANNSPGTAGSVREKQFGQERAGLSTESFKTRGKDFKLSLVSDSSI